MYQPQNILGGALLKHAHDNRYEREIFSYSSTKSPRQLPFTICVSLSTLVITINVCHYPELRGAISSCL